jgi:hypothetical protein
MELERLDLIGVDVADSRRETSVTACVNVGVDARLEDM